MHPEDANGPDNDRPTINPPYDVEAFARAASGPRKHPHDTPTERPPPMREQQVTLTNEVELERARLKSAASSAPPGPTRMPTPSPLSLVNAQSSSTPPEQPSTKPPPASLEAALLGAVVPGAPGAASMNEPEIRELPEIDPIVEMHDRFSLGDYTGALEIAEIVLADDPDCAEAAECAEQSRAVLVKMYTARLGPLDRVPIVVVPRTQLRWLSLDHRAGFMLSLCDGATNLEAIADLCGMPRVDALRILYELVQQRVIAFR
jgi:hypothetical protein